jgi:sortase A
MVGRLMVAVAMSAALVGCSDAVETIAGTPNATPRVVPAPTRAIPKPTLPPKPKSSPKPKPSPAVQRTTTMAIPAIGVRGLRVVAYTGTADDRPGTVIQNQRVAASPRGPAGGIGPGEIGNFIVTAHRTTRGRPFGRVPDLQDGDHILITSGGFVYDYLVNRTMTISFRKPAELAQQNAAVPGHPGEVPTSAMITLSTCATTEDHAAGNYWKDAIGNPEHRINKIGVLVATRSA